tara:strand:+ start:278 stop:727 length:450 start_codon:yes stop_codon:yes gene_type:complete
MVKYFLSVSISILFISSNYIFANEDKEEALPEERLEAAKEVLKSSANISLIYVKGLVCPSCAIGIRKNLSKMLGVDRSRFKDGIDMDPETQLVTISLREGVSLDNKDLIELVEDAGYTAIEEYKLHDGHLDALKFRHDASVKIVHHAEE